MCVWRIDLNLSICGGDLEGVEGKAQRRQCPSTFVMGLQFSQDGPCLPSNPSPGWKRVPATPPVGEKGLHKGLNSRWLEFSNPRGSPWGLLTKKVK